MSEIKVYLDIGKHPFYESLILYPPKNVIYVNFPKKILKEYETLAIYRSFRYVLFKKILSKAQYLTSIPRLKIVRKKNFDIYHSSRGIFVIGTDYIMDLEYISSPYGLNYKITKRKISKKILMKLFLQKNLKKILFHSHTSIKAFINFFGNPYFKKIREKIDVLYPAVIPRVKKSKSIKDKNKIILLFVSSSKINFIRKGGMHLLYSFLELREKYDVELWICSDVFDVIKKKYSNIARIFSFVPRNKIFDIYKKADIFVYPSYFDTWGYVLLEAMSCGLPIVTSNTFAIPEIVRDRINGLIFDASEYKWDLNYLPRKFSLKFLLRKDNKIINRIKEKISELIENSELYNRISKNNLEEVSIGRFSIRNRNKKLEEIYISALEH